MFLRFSSKSNSFLKSSAFILGFVCMIVCTAQPGLAQTTEKRNRVEELFIWKLSEDLKLSVSEEKAFSDLVRELNKKRQQVNADLAASVEAMAAASVKDRPKLLIRYKTLLKQYSDVSLEEIQRMEKILGAEKASVYLVKKAELTNKLKTLLGADVGDSKIATDKTDKKVELPAPKIIEE